jgi:hypothetical protein
MNIGKSNATSFKKGHARIPGAGRKPGTPNRTTQQLKDAILEAADRLGYIREEPKLDDITQRFGKRCRAREVEKHEDALFPGGMTVPPQDDVEEHAPPDQSPQLEARAE